MAIVVNLDVVMAKKKMGVTTLDALCRALDCQPGDILEYVPDEP